MKSLVDLLAKRDTSYRVFGSGGKYGGHYYRFLPKLSEADIAAFERKNKVELPQDYRLYLVTVADGGVGPDYGLSSLESAAHGASLESPFPWVEKTELKSNAEFDLWDRHPGFLELCHHGCGYYDILVVNGQAKGSMWQDILAATSEIVPLGVSFFAWYRQWVFEKLSRLEKEPLIDSIVEGMSLETVTNILGPIENTWQNNANPELKFVSFQNAAASFTIGAHGIVEKIYRLSL